jgi:hypothetical protein
MIAALLALVVVQGGVVQARERSAGTGEDFTVRGRLLDAISGAPVAGATCELWTEDFDQPGRMVESVVSRADGRYELHLQTRDEVKVRLRAPGYRSTVVSNDGELDLLYPSDEPLVVRVLDLDGQPIAGARIRSHQTCRHAPPAVEGVSDADGRVVLEGAPIRSSPEYEVRASGYGALVPVYFDDSDSDPCVFLPRRAPVRLRLLDVGGQPLANMRFRQQGPGLTAFITDAQGCAVLDSLFESREIGLEDMTKQLHLYGWPPLEGELVLRPERHLADERDGWPVLRVVGAERGASVHVQFGDDSVTRDDGVRPMPGFDVRVRPGIPVLVLAQGNEVRRARLEPWEGTRELDLAAPERLVRPRVERGEPVKLAFRLRTPEGEPLAAKGHWLRPYADKPPADEDPSPDGVAFSVPRGARYHLLFSADGHVSLGRIGRAGEPMREPEVVVLPRSD